MDFNDSIYPWPRGRIEPASPNTVLTRVELWFHRTGAGAMAESWDLFEFADTIQAGGAGNLWPSHFPQVQDIRLSPPQTGAGNDYDSVVQTLADIEPRDLDGSGEVRAVWKLLSGYYGRAGMKPITFATPRVLTLTFDARRRYWNQSNTFVTENFLSVSAAVTVSAGVYGWNGTVSTEATGEYTRIATDVAPKSGSYVEWTFTPVSVA